MTRTRSLLGLAATMAALLFAATASASVIQVAAGDVTVNDTTNCSLIDAINAANASTVTNTTVGACTPTGTPNGGGVMYGVTYTSGNFIILAAGPYTLTQINNDWYGPNGLPPVSSPIIIVGDPSGSIIERSTVSGTPAFRLFYIGGGLSLTNYNPPSGLTNLPGWGTKDTNGNLQPGSLTLVNLTLENGLAQGGVGGGMGAGGAIYNQGNLIMTGDTLTLNKALGGGGSGGFGGGGGGGVGGGGSFPSGSPGSPGAGGGGFQDPSGLWTQDANSGGFGNGGLGGGGVTSGVGGNGSQGGSGGGGGGGGMGGGNGGNGGNGGFGGGGGAGGLGGSGGHGGNGGNGGNGGFGGGGGAAGLNNVGAGPGAGGLGGFGGGGGFGSGGGGGAGLGGAVFNEGGTVSILNSTFTANTAQGGGGYSGGSGYGGGLFNLNGTVTVRYSTLAGNSVIGGAATGGGIAGSDSGGTVYNLFSSKPGSPTADAGTAATMTVNSSILSGSVNSTTGVSDCENNAGTFTSGHDVVQTTGSCIFTNNDQAGTGKLAALAANGGSTETMALQAGSLAINNGDTSTGLGPVPTVDQRGFSRDSQPDVGAFEYNGGLTITGLADTSVTAPGPASENFTLTGIGALTVSAVSSDTTLLPDSNIVISSGCGSDSSHLQCTLTLTPAAGQSGSGTVTVTVSDAYSGSTQSAFMLTVNKPAAPTISAIANQTITAGQSTGALAFTLTGTGALRVSATSNNTPLVPNANIAVSSGCGSSTKNCTLTLAPASSHTGSSIITLTATDPYGSSAEGQFVLTVTPVLPPVADNSAFTAYTNTTFSGMLPAAVTPASDKLSVSAGSASHGTVTVTNAATGAFTYTPANGYTGSDSFTFTAKDTVTGLVSNTATVTITVNAVPAAAVPPAAPPSSSGGGGGGGAFGWLSLLLLAGLGLGRGVKNRGRRPRLR